MPEHPQSLSTKCPGMRFPPGPRISTRPGQRTVGTVINSQQPLPRGVTLMSTFAVRESSEQALSVVLRTIMAI